MVDSMGIRFISVTGLPNMDIWYRRDTRWTIPTSMGLYTIGWVGLLHAITLEPYHDSTSNCFLLNSSLWGVLNYLGQRELHSRRLVLLSLKRRAIFCTNPTLGLSSNPSQSVLLHYHTSVIPHNHQSILAINIVYFCIIRRNRKLLIYRSRFTSFFSMLNFSSQGSALP